MHEIWHKLFTFFTSYFKNISLVKMTFKFGFIYLNNLKKRIGEYHHQNVISYIKMKIV